MGAAIHVVCLLCRRWCFSSPWKCHLWHGLPETLLVMVVVVFDFWFFGEPVTDRVSNTTECNATECNATEWATRRSEQRRVSRWSEATTTTTTTVSFLGLFSSWWWLFLIFDFLASGKLKTTTGWDWVSNNMTKWEKWLSEQWPSEQHGWAHKGRQQQQQQQ